MIVAGSLMFVVASAEPSSTGASASTNWDRFYAAHVGTAYRFLGASLVLGVALSVASGLVSGLLVKPDAPEWNAASLRYTKCLGVAIILLSAFGLPGYAMLKNFTPLNTVSAWAWLIVMALILATFGLFAWSQDFQSADWYRGSDWQVFRRCLTALGIVVLVVGSGAKVPSLEHPTPQLVVCYAAMCVLGVIVTAVSFGQNLKAQVEVRAGDGKRDEAATEYLLARLTTLGLEQQRDVSPGLPSKALGALVNSDLSATPAGQLVGTIAHVVFAVRPGLTWRLAVAFVDDGRLAMTLSRNGRLADVDVFGRQDVELARIDRADPDAVDRARAQLLTGAGAFILHHLSLVYPKSRAGLGGATKWRSTTLQVIASSKSLTSGGEKPLQMLRLATNMDPRNANARYEYLRALIKQRPGSRYAADLATRLDELRDEIIPEDPAAEVTLQYQRLAPQILYRSAFTWLAIATHHAHEHGSDPAPDLARAMASIDTFNQRYPAGETTEDEAVEPLRRYIANLKLCVEAFDGEPPRRQPDTVNVASPSLAYNYACFEAQALNNRPAKTREAALTRLFRDLAFAMSTETVKDMARRDLCFRDLREDPRFVILTSPPPPQDFLGLPPFASFAAPLAKACLTTPSLVEAATRRPEQRADLATFLKVPTATVDRMAGIAGIGAVHQDLADAKMLYLLQHTGIESFSNLRMAVVQNRIDFLVRLRQLAEPAGLTDLPGLVAPAQWLRAVIDRPIAVDEPSSTGPEHWLLA
ncbi:hypothetical protein ACFQ9X_48635 [Catenulispora yoronensis]